MSQQAKKGCVPVLRFPEFRNMGEWEEKKLGNVLIFQAGFPFDSASFTEERKGLRLIRNRDLKSDDRIIFYKNSFNENFVVNDGDVLVGMDGDFTPCVWSKGKALLNQRVGRILPKSNNNLRFMYYFLTLHLKGIEEATARTTVKHLSHSDVEKITEPFPTLSEQQRIADCLSSLDELITAQGQKVEALKTHKKGLMQQLFPAEGETVPKLRFPEFRDAGEWKEKQFENVAKFSKGKGVSKSDISPNGAQPCIRYGELYTHYSETIESVISYTDISSDDLVLSEANDVIIPASGETQVDIATASCVLKSGIALGGDLNIR